MAIIKIEEKYEYLKDVLLSILLIGIAFVINAGMSIRGLYQDDLFMWSTRRGVGFFKYVFPDQTRKFRPVYNYSCNYSNRSVFLCQRNGKVKRFGIYTGFNVFDIQIFIL